ncbi:MAG: AAA family ATPase [Actinomycetota bacterium]
MSAAEALIGREAELALLLDAATGRADRSAVLLGGDAGMGKTRLVEELRARLPDDVAVGVGACIHTAHGSLPLVAVTEALRSLGSEVDGAVASMPAHVSAELGALVPELVPGGPTVEPPRDDERTVYRLFDAIRTFLTSLAARQRVCLVVEDLHWADASTRDLVTFLVQRGVGDGFSLIGTYRSDEMSRTHPLRPVLAELDRSPRVRHLTLRPFDDTELARFAASRLGRPPSARLVDDLADRSSGNVFYAAELLDAMRDGQPTVRPELSDLVLARVEATSTDAQRLLRLVAVAGESVRDELLELVLEPDDEDVLDALGEVVEQRLLVVGDDGRMRFRHALMQEAVHHGTLPRERRVIHRRFAEALAARPDLASSPLGANAELAWHHREAREFAAALEASAAAARSAEAVPAFSEALEHVRTLLELWDDVDDAEDRVGMPHADVLRWAAELAHEAGDSPQGVVYQRAAIAAMADAEPATRGLLHERLGRFLQAAGRADDAIAEYERGVDLVTDPASPERAVVLAGYGQQLMLTLRHREAVVALDGAIDVARHVGDRRIEGHALNSLGSMYLHDGRYTRGVGLLEEAAEIARTEGAHGELLRTYVNVVSGLVDVGDLAAAERHADEGLRRAAELGHESFFIGANLVFVLTEQGRWEDAAAVSDSLRRPEGHLPHLWLAHSSSDRAFWRGDLEGAARTLDDSEPPSGPTMEPQLVPMHWARRAALAIGSGDPSVAREAVERGLAAVVTMPQELELRILAVEIEVDAGAAGSEESVVAHLDAIDRLVDERFDRSDNGAHRILALAAEAAAHRAALADEDSVERWSEAVEQWGASGCVLRLLRCRLRLGEAQLRSGDRSSAEATLLDVVDRAEALGTPVIGAAAQRLLDHAGLTAADEDSPDLLTSRERDVLRLVADGRTNRQIGDRLFISPKTASVHVSRILQKLGVDNRTEAAAAARRAGLLDDELA